MTKITAEHLARSAYVYVRQSTADQLTHNHESRRRQYALADRARQLGWTTVEIVDDDLGRSGGGIARPGFDRLIGAICAGGVGAVLAIEASRLARNGRDWHTLIEFCGLVGTILVDEDGIYDTRHPNDRLLLGMKGTMSELELSLFRQRSQEALRQDAMLNPAGTFLPESIEPSDQPNPVLDIHDTEETALEKMVEYSPSLGGLRESIRTALLQVKFQENQLLPQVNLGAQFGFSATSGTTPCVSLNPAVAGSGNSFYLRFTSVSPEIDRLFEAQTANPKMPAAPFQPSNGAGAVPDDLAPRASGGIQF